MTASREAKRSAIAALAAHFSAPWEIGEGPPDAYAVIGGRRIALEVAIVAQPSHPARVAKARLRDDRVARRVLRDLHIALHAHVPRGRSIILTLGAPIKVPKQLVAALTKLLVEYVQGTAVERDVRKTVLGNRVRFRVLERDPRWSAKVMAFVFSGDPAPSVIASSMRMFHDAVVAASKRAASSPRRWLILSGNDWFADIDTYRLIYSRLSLARNFEEIYMVLDGGRVEALRRPAVSALETV